MIRIDDLHTRATLVKLSISTWSARKFDKTVTASVNAQHNAQDAGRFNKKLLASDAESYKALIKLCNEARSAHYENTLAWGDDGYRLLPSSNYMEYVKIMRALKVEFDNLLSKFVGDYPLLIESAKSALNGMFVQSDYPSTWNVRHRFDMASDFLPLPTVGDFRVTLPEAEVQALQASVARKVQASADEALDDARGRLVEVVKKMTDKLSDPTAIFRDTLVTNGRDLVDVLSRLNLGDKELEAMRERVERELSTVDAEDLRNDPTTRRDVASKASKILSDMGDVFGGAK